MKQCGYCGAENEESWSTCRGCGTVLPEKVVAEDTKPDPEPQFIPDKFQIDLGQFDGAFDFCEGFSRPNWQIIDRAVGAADNDLSLDERWDEVALQWMLRLREELGGNYRVSRDRHLILLSTLSAKDAQRFVEFGENALIEIRQRLGDLAWKDTFGPHAVLLFGDDDDYFEYVGFFDRREVIPGSLGMHLGDNYSHTAIRSAGGQQDVSTLVHELTHHCITHLPIPLWLNEGVAQRLQRFIVGIYAARKSETAGSLYWRAVSAWSPPLMWHELAEQHHAFWNEKNIQSFWAGTSFGEGDEMTGLSYSLAEVLVHLLSDDRESFLAFLARAHFADAGQTAALDCFGQSLGDVATTFLGQGNWRPVRKAMVDLWTTRIGKPDR